MTENMKLIIALRQLLAQKGIPGLIIVVSKTKHFRNTSLKSETIEMIPESIVLVWTMVKTEGVSQDDHSHSGFVSVETLLQLLHLILPCGFM